MTSSPMAHAVLGAGGVGGLIGGALARLGDDVTFVIRPGTVEEYPPTLSVDSSVFGVFEVPASFVERLGTPVDVLWVTLKNQQFETAMADLDPQLVAGALVVPLMNGVDHVEQLRTRLPQSAVAAGAIRTEATRVAPGVIVHRGWHTVPESEVKSAFPQPTSPVQLSGPVEILPRIRELAERLRAAGVPCQVWDDENYLLWNKLAILCPYALATTAAAGTIGAVRADPQLKRLLTTSTHEVLDVAAALGVELDTAEIIAMLDRFPDSMRVSMERDSSRGVPIEIEAVATPVIRIGKREGISVVATEELFARATASTKRVAERLRATSWQG